MSLKRYATKRDQSEPAILQALTAVGADYLLLDAIDVLVWFRGRLFLLECKAGRGRRTRNQDVLVARGWPVCFVRTPEDALAAIGLGRNDRPLDDQSKGRSRGVSIGSVRPPDPGDVNP